MADSYWQTVRTRQPSRRALLRAGLAGLGTAGLAVAGCGGNSNNSAGKSTGTATQAPRQAAAASPAAGAASAAAATRAATPAGTPGASSSTGASGASPAGTPKRGGILRQGDGPLGAELDIHRTNTPFESAGIWHWAGNFLMRFNKDVLPEPDAAMAQPEITDNGLTLTFKLRPEAK